ncbi:MAG: universal stress protein [Deltaproteobacteria bacterium]|jgi:universal stress protein A|nr:universal stress protein [Deltaproteobacteria bacterium]
MIPIQTILAPIDFSDKSQHAAEFAAWLAAHHKAALYLLYVTDPVSNIGCVGNGYVKAAQQSSIPEKLAQLSAIISRKVEDAIPVHAIQMAGTPVHQVILDKARDLEVDLIVMPAPGHKGLGSFFKKSVTALIIQRARCHVFLVR